jgi:hypothetical protein
MRRMCADEGAKRGFPRGLLPAAALLFWLTACGCKNTCVSFTSNSTTGTVIIGVTDVKPTCTLSKTNGTVRVQVGASRMQSAGAEPSSIQHIFVSLRGIEAHPSTIADEDSPDWQELAPKLAQQPMQVDLMARTANSCAPGSFGEVAVAPGTYRRIRLRLLPNQPATSEPVPENNACGSVGFNCVVTADGSVRPLALDGATPELRITSEQIAGGFFLVLPDAGTDLAIEFNTFSSLAWSAGDAVRLVAVFTAAPRAPCQFLGGSER